MAIPKKSSSIKKTTPKKSSAAVYDNSPLRDKLKAEITAGDKGGKSGQWSARKAQMLAIAYKKAGGGYLTKKSEAQTHLDDWTDEKWKTSDGKPAIREGETARYLPKEAWDKLTDAEKKATESKKRAGSKAGKQFVPNTEPAKAARKLVAKRSKPS